MKAHWWGCLLGLLCMPAEVTLTFWTASQSPASISHVRVNSSFEITCTTSLVNPMGVGLNRHFHNDKTVVYLYIENGLIKKKTINKEFENRTDITPAQVGQGLEFTVKLSLLGLNDTDLYYCKWVYEESGSQYLESNGTIIIVREKGPQDQCKDPNTDLNFVHLSILGFTVFILSLIVTLVWKYRRFQEKFTPARPPLPRLPPRHLKPPPRPPRPPKPPTPIVSQSICLQHQQHSHQHYTYLITATDTYGFRDTRICLEQDESWS